jgi:hypothetical protein
MLLIRRRHGRVVASLSMHELLLNLFNLRDLSSPPLVARQQTKNHS